MLSLWSQSDDRRGDFYQTSIYVPDATYLWSAPTIGNIQGRITLASTYAASTDDYTSLNSTVEPGETLELVKIAFQVLSNAESGNTHFAFVEEYANKLIYYTSPTEETQADVAGLTMGEKSLSIKGVTPTLDKVTLENDSVQVNGSDDTTVKATATSAKGTDITTGVTWSVAPADQGVTVAADGQITVDAKAKAVEYTITATPGGTNSQGVAKSATLTVTRAGSTPAGITVSGADTVTVPTSDSTEVTYTAVVTDQFGDTMSRPPITWSISSGMSEGISLDNSGKLTVTNAAAAGNSVSVTIKAESGSVSATKTVTVAREASVPTSVVVTIPEDSNTVTVPALNESSKTVTASAEVKDQYGVAMSVQDITWSLDAAPAGVTINQEGEITVAPAVQNGSVTVKAACGSVHGTATLTVQRAESVATTVKILRGGTEVSGTDTVVKPVTGGADKEYTYSAQVLDQYGSVMEEASAAATLSMTESSVTGVSFAGGKLTVTDAAVKGTTVNLTAEYSDKTASVTVTITDLAVDWSGVEVASSIVYGTTNFDAVTNLPASGTADAAGTKVTGTFSVVDEDTIQGVADTVTVTVQFTADANAGEYANVVVTKDYSVTVSKKPITATVTPVSCAYNEAIPTLEYTLEPGALVGEDELALTLITTASKGSDAGRYDVTGTAANGNYEVTLAGGTGALTITPAAITGWTVTEWTGIWASDGKNASTDALLAAVKDGRTSNIAAAYANGSTTVNAEWKLTTGTWDIKGGIYTYTATLIPTDTTNFVVGDFDKTLTVTVKAVNAALSLSSNAASKTMSQVKSAADYAALGLPMEVTITYNDGTTDPDTAGITSWSMTMDQLKAVDASEEDQVRTLTPTVDTADIPAWATLGERPTFTLTITNKYPVTVTANAPANITYGEAVGDPSASQTALENGTDPAGTYTYTYVGVNGTVYGPSGDKPTDAGTYQVTATLVSDTHTGSGSAQFTISKKTLTADMLAITGSYTFTGSAITPAYTVSDKPVATELIKASDYTVEVTNSINAWSSGDNAPTVTVTATESGNYSGAISETFTIAPKSVAADDVTVTGLPASVTYTGKAITPKATVKFGDILLAEGTDYTLSYEANTNAGTATVKVTGKGNYDGTKSASFAIAAAPASGVVTISGTNYNMGTQLTATATGKVGTLTYAWYRNGVAIESADSKTYTLTAADEGAKITVKVTSAGNYVGTLESAAIEVGKTPVPAGVTLTVSGGSNVGDTLTAAVGGTSFDVANYSIVWLRDGKQIATGETYKLTADDQGHTITAKLVAKGEYTGELAASGAAAVAAAAPGKPTVNTSAGDGSVTISWSAADNGSAIFQYQVKLGDGAWITLPAGTTSYTFDGLTNGTSYTFAVKAINAEGTSAEGTVTAAPKAPTGGNTGGGITGGSTVTRYTITVKQTEGGEITPDTVRVKRGDDQTFRIVPDEGYEIDEVLVDGKSVGAVSRYTFEDVREAHTIQAIFVAQQAPAFQFSDVDPDGWAAPYIYELYDRGIVGGVGGTLFAPTRNITRAEFVKILAGVADVTEDELSYESTGFTDVEPGSWYEAYVVWAVENGVTTGTSATTFAPSANITREQMAVMIYRFAQSSGIDLPANQPAVSFSDAASFSSWAVDAIGAMQRAGIINGVGGNRFAPADNATREQACKMLAVLLEIIED